MSGPDLPQPIYPTDGPEVGGRGHRPPPPGGQPVGGGFAGGDRFPPPAPASGGGNRTPLIVGAIVAVAVVAAVAIVALRGGEDAPPPTATSPSGGSAGADVGGGGSGGGNGSGGGDPGGGGAADVGDRAVAVTDRLFGGGTPATRSCVSESLTLDEALLGRLEGQGADGVVLDDGGDADRYVAIMVECATDEELATNVGAFLRASGYDEVTVNCVEAEATLQWSEREWSSYLVGLVHPARYPESEALLVDVGFYC